MGASDLAEKMLRRIAEAETRASAAEAEIARLTRERDEEHKRAELGWQAWITACEVAEAANLQLLKDESTVSALRERVARLEEEASRLRKDNERLRWRHPAVLPDWNDLPEAMRVKLSKTADCFDPVWGGDLVVNLYRDLREDMTILPSQGAPTYV